MAARLTLFNLLLLLSLSLTLPLTFDARAADARAETTRANEEKAALEHLSLWEVRSRHRLAFEVILGLAVDPHVAVAFSKVGGSAFDRAIFGPDWATQSPFFARGWLRGSLFALALPGVSIIQYLAFFFDTDPLLVLLMGLSFLTYDVSFYLELSSSFSEPSLKPFLLRFAASFMGALAQAATLLALNLFILVPYVGALPRFALDAYFFVALVSAPALLLRRAGRLLRTARLVCGRAARGGVDPAARAAVIRELTAAGPLFRESRPEDIAALYEPVRLPAGADGGSFTRNLRFGKHRTQKAVFVVLKEISTEMEMDLQKLYLKFVGSVRASGPLGLPEVAKLGAAELAKRGAKRAYAESEVRALRAVKALQCPHIIQLFSAHAHKTREHGDVFTIVTGYLGENWDAAARPRAAADRLRHLSNACAALAALHEGGMAHRDIKPDNIAGEGALLDVGLVLLPHGDDAHKGRRGCEFFAPPEAQLFSHPFHRPATPLVQSASTAAAAPGAGTARGAPAASSRRPPAASAAGPPGVWSGLRHFFSRALAAGAWRRCAREGWRWLLSRPAREKARDVQAGCLAVVAFIEAWGVMGAGDRAVVAPLAVVQSGDVWAMGLVAMWYLLGDGRFKEDGTGYICAELWDHKDTAESAAFERVLVPDELHARGGAALRELLAALLQRSPESRISAREAAARFKALAGLCRSEAPAAAAAARADSPAARRASERDGETRALARHNQLAVTRSLVRIAVSSGDLPLRPPLTGAQRAAILAAFRGVGSVSRGDDFSALLRRANVDLARLHLTPGEVFTLMDVDSSGRVDKREFLATLSFLLEPQLSATERLRFLFDAWDTDGSGALEPSEVREMLAAYGFPPPPPLAPTEADIRGAAEAERALAELFRAFDKDSSGGLDFEELAHAVRANDALRARLLEGTAWMGRGAASPRAVPPPAPPTPSPPGSARRGGGGGSGGSGPSSAADGGGGGRRRRLAGSK